MITSGARVRISSVEACTDSRLDVGEDIGAARGLEHVVQEAAAAAGVDVPQRAALAAEDEQRPRLWRAGRSRRTREPPLDAAASVSAGVRATGPRAEPRIVAMTC